MGSVDTKYMDAQSTDRAKRNAIGTYFNSGLSQYVVETNASIQYSEGAHFPANWDPRYTLFQGVAAFPDHREDYRVNKDGPRRPTINLTAEENYTANYKDAPTGFLINGTLPVSADQGVHSLTDVPVFAMGPCQETFGGEHCSFGWLRTSISLGLAVIADVHMHIGVYDSTEVFFHMANCFGLSRSSNSTTPRHPGYQNRD